MTTTQKNIIIGRAHQGGVGAKTAYESSVIARAVQRAGSNPHLKGHIHEILIQDSRNVRNLFNGARTELTKSTTASTVDLVTMRGGKSSGGSAFAKKPQNPALPAGLQEMMGETGMPDLPPNLGNGLGDLLG